MPLIVPFRSRVASAPKSIQSASGYLLFVLGSYPICGFCGNTESLQANIGILPENIPRSLYFTLQYVSYRASSSVVLTAITMRAPVVTRSRLLLHCDLMEPLPHLPPPFLLLSRGLVVHYTLAEIQRGIIYSIYIHPHSLSSIMFSLSYLFSFLHEFDCV